MREGANRRGRGSGAETDHHKRRPYFSAPPLGAVRASTGSNVLTVASLLMVVILRRASAAPALPPCRSCLNHSDACGPLTLGAPCYAHVAQLYAHLDHVVIVAILLVLSVQCVCGAMVVLLHLAGRPSSIDGAIAAPPPSPPPSGPPTMRSLYMPSSNSDVRQTQGFFSGLPAPNVRAAHLSAHSLLQDTFTDEEKDAFIETSLLGERRKKQRAARSSATPSTPPVCCKECHALNADVRGAQTALSLDTLALLDPPPRAQKRI